MNKSIFKIALTILILSQFTHSEKLYWKGGVSSIWNLSLLNWLRLGGTGGLIPALGFPGAGDEIFITDSGDYTVTFDSNTLINFKSIVVGSATGTGKQILKVTKDIGLTSEMVIEKSGQLLVEGAATIQGAAIKLNGTLNAAGAGLKKITSQITNGGLIDITNDAVLEIASTYVQEDPKSTLSLTSGNLTVSAGGDLTIKNGTVKGTGQLTAKVFTHGGVLAAGNSPGVFYVKGDLNLPVNSVLDVEIDTNTNDLVVVSGKATVQGFVNFKSIGSYAHTVGRNIKFLTFTSHDYKPILNILTGNGFFNKKATISIGSVSVDMKTEEIIGGGAIKPSVVLSLFLCSFMLVFAFF